MNAQSLDDIIKLLEPIFKQVTIKEETTQLKLKHKGYQAEGIDKVYALCDTIPFMLYSYPVSSIEFWVSKSDFINTADIEIIADQSFLKKLETDLGEPEKEGWSFYNTNQTGNGRSFKWKYKSYPVLLIIYNLTSTAEPTNNFKFIVSIVPEEYWSKKN
ncbi:MAG: hypothetical protein EAZ16_07185 [Sphingobacteriales bacterium]|nr:MAG: hypothetical protein EAZ16_07185 [Sphingobacteriales bacterium]